MGFLGVYKAVYNYAPQGESELAISEGDILYVLEKTGEDGWWRAKKKAKEDDDDEPTGLVPENYIEEAEPTHQAQALYDYTRQTDEELSFTEHAQLEVFDDSDPDWILVGCDGEYGFVPSNYIELQEDGGLPPTKPARPSVTRDDSEDVDDSNEHASAAPAAAMANIMSGRGTRQVAPPPALNLPQRPQYTPEASDEDEQPTPTLPARPSSQTVSSHGYPTPRSPPSGIAASPPYNRAQFHEDDDEPIHAPGGYHLYNINEMVSVMGKKKKMPTTLGINLGTGKIMIAPEKARDGPSQEWTAEKMTHYSIEGKHVFLELIRPSKSVDFHAGAKDTAHEIDAALRDLAGAVKAEGLREVLMAASGGSKQKTGHILYDFMAQGEDEVSVAVDDEVIIVDDTKSEEWWQVRRVKNGKEGVVPSSYVEITGTISSSGGAGIDAGRSTVERNRLEEQRLAKEALRASRTEDDVRAPEVGPGVRPPERGSSLLAFDSSNVSQQRNSRTPDSSQSKATKSKPDPTKVRSWTDRSKSFSVEAQFLALKDGKINLHKMNGVKIAVPVAKMSIEDLEYVERITGVSLDEDKPLSELKRQKSRRDPESSKQTVAPSTAAGASVDTTPEYDWFQFFLSCDVAVGLCERYAQSFNRSSIDESVLSDVDASVLRNLGIREGDIIKIMRHLDQKFNRQKRNAGFAGSEADGDDGSQGGLFSGPGGTLKNNTRKGRPAPALQTNDVVDAKAFQQEDDRPHTRSTNPPSSSASTQSASRKSGVNSGFDDDAWDVKPSKTATPPPQLTRPQPSQPTLTGSMQDLSLLDTPLPPALEPTRIQPTRPATANQQQAPAMPQSQMAPQQTGATPAFFSTVTQQPTGFNPQQAYAGQFAHQLTGFGAQQTQQNMARARPVAPQYTQSQNTLMIPPPPRPLSAPQAPQQSAFSAPPLQPQMTGYNQATSIAPPGQSLAEMHQMRMQQQYQQQQQQQQMNGYGGQQTMMPQVTGYNGFNVPQQTGFNQTQLQPQQTGFNQQPAFNQMQGPFSDPRSQQFSPLQAQPTGFQSSFPQQQFPQQTGVNAFLPPALQPQKTGPMQSQSTGMNGFGQNSFGQNNYATPPVPPMPEQPQQQQQQTLAPLQPQKTGPPPPVRFGVTGDTKKLMPQATGRRANLAQSTPQNPFGF